MIENKLVARNVIDSAVYSVSGDVEVKTALAFSKRFTPVSEDDGSEKKAPYKHVTLVTHYFTLALLGVLTWGLLWSVCGDGWRWDGPWFRMAGVAAAAWAAGLALQGLTTLPPLLAALLVGILARNLDLLSMRDYSDIDSLLRKIYPVVILGKASLGWDVGFMRAEWKLVLSLGLLPWITEVAVLTVCTRVMLGFPWLWGVLLGSIYASVSCAVVMPSVLQQQQQQHAAAAARRNMPQIVCTAGGLDTLLSVGVYGLLFSFMFSDTADVYSYVKAGLTLFVGVVLGVAWGSLAKLAPNCYDSYVTELRVLFVLIGGLFCNFFTMQYGWGGTGGVAVLACNATAATHWARDGWPLNRNPAATAYRVLWSALEPMVFAYSGTFFVIEKSLANTLLVGLGILLVCLTARLLVTWLVCWDFSLKERLYICCTWIPKSIVEAVLCPLAITAVLSRGHASPADLERAEQVMQLLVEAILVTTPLGFLLTRHLGPRLLAGATHTPKPDSDLESDKRMSVSINGAHGDLNKTL